MLSSSSLKTVPIWIPHLSTCAELLTLLEDSWDETVGTPYLIKINPDILPVAMTAVDYGDKNRLEIIGVR